MDAVKRTDIMLPKPITASPIAPLPGPDLGGEMAVGRPIETVSGPSPAAGRVKRLPAVQQSELRGMMQDMAARPPVDMARVQALRAQIDSGSFTIDPARVADAMLGSVRGR